ncbi:MAG TPA: hypothetical protein PK657_07765 [Legionella sp.]|nr:hypothetical protein [Legionella sp.]
MVNAQKEEHDLDNFFDALNKTVVTAQTTLIQVNELLSQFTPTKSAQYLFKNDDNNTNRTLSHQESAAKNDPLTKEMFGRVEEIYHTKNGYKQLYDGIKYKLPDSNSFLLSHFNEEQKQNLKDVLQWRDKLFVLSNELRTVYNTAKDNRVATRSEFLPLIDSYLKEINRVKMELQVCVERFDLDCHTVYRSRENQVIIDGERKNWENQYLDKNSIEGFRAQTIALKRDIASAFSQISFNHFVSLKKIGAENDDIAIRGKELFGDFSMPNSNFQKTINQAQTNELLRQADIILLRLQQLSDDCDDLLKKASSMENKDESAIRLLQYRKEALSQMLQTMQNHPVDEGTDIMENEFVIIENDNPNTEIINAYSSGNLLELIDGKSVDVERNQLKAKLEFYRTMPDDLSENSKSFLGSIEEKLNAQGAEKVKTIITNFERIVNQGMDYKEAYIKDAGHYDKTVFFSHNNNGKKNASKVMGQWKKDSEEVLKQVLKSFKGDKVDWKKESTINEFKEALESALQESMKNLIVNESYSSYKEHSFRNYLHQFYKNVFPENNPDVLANKLEKREVKFNEVPGFNEQTLRNFEKNLQPEPQAQMRM